MSPFAIIRQQLRAARISGCNAVIGVLESWIDDAERLLAHTSSDEVFGEYRARLSLLLKIRTEMIAVRDRGE